MDTNKRALLEAALFQASGPLSVEEIAKIVELPEQEVETCIEELILEYKAEHKGMEIVEVGERYEMRVKKPHAQRVAHLTPYADLSRGLLKALSLIVYKQPITQSDIVKTIGNRGYDYVKDLEERGLIKTEKYRRSKRIELTDHFMSYFGISSRKDLIEMFKKQEAEEATQANTATQTAPHPDVPRTEGFGSDEKTDEAQ
ncbi:MAG: SMC-Scp complex subunit ScpB [Candidatus Aenigmatarchaeota archaeon]|nr:MAG: SMC-Scp complex subunit ScpB [Candidatus Aenigmarchaeota archaeon]